MRSNINKKFRILIVEDEPGIQFLLSAQLKSLGYETFLAGDSDQALKHLEQSGHIDLVIADNSLPGSLTGAALLQAIYAKEEYVKGILMSGAKPDSLADITDFTRSTPFIMKPFKLAEIAAVIDTVMHST